MPPKNNSTPTAPRPQRDWDAIVKESQQTPSPMFRIPDSFLDRCRAWQAKRIEFNKKVEEVSKFESDINVDFASLVQDIRTHFEKSGLVEFPWTSDVGFETTALKEGKFIIQFTSNKQ